MDILGCVFTPGVNIVSGAAPCTFVSATRNMFKSHESRCRRGFGQGCMQRKCSRETPKGRERVLNPCRITKITQFWESHRYYRFLFDGLLILFLITCPYVPFDGILSEKESVCGRVYLGKPMLQGFIKQLLIAFCSGMREMSSPKLTRPQLPASTYNTRKKNDRSQALFSFLPSAVINRELYTLLHGGVSRLRCLILWLWRLLCDYVLSTE